MTLINKNDNVLLSHLWLFILLNIIFRDIHQFANVSFLTELTSGTVNGTVIIERLTLLGGVLAEIPILMVILSRVLPNKLNKWFNIIAGSITMIVFLTALPHADLDDYFHFGFETAAFVWIFQIAWRLPVSIPAQSHSN